MSTIFRCTIAVNLFSIPSAALPNTTTFTSIDVPGALVTVARGINPQGEIVGWYVDSATQRQRGYLWSKGEFTWIDVPGATHTIVHANNAVWSENSTFRLRHCQAASR